MSQKAFPTATGGGANSRADVVYEHRIVTNLNEDGVGSFRWAINNPNTIVSFNVSGVAINTNTTYNALNNVIVLGQTAPLGGFEYGGPGIRADYVNNFIMRYVSLRNTWFGRDALDFIGAEDVIIDHCSVSFGGDETMSFRASYADAVVHRVSNANNHFNFSKTGMLLGDSDDTTKNIDLSSIGNLWSVISHRHPNVNITGRADVIGNVVFDWANRIMVTGGSVVLNEINNSYLAPSGNGSKNQARVNTVGTPTETTTCRIYTAGNTHTGIGITESDDQWGTGSLVQGQFRPAPVIATQGLWQNRVVNYTSGQFEHDVFPLDGYDHPEYRVNTMHPLMNFQEVDLQNGAWWRNKIITERNVGNCARLDNNGNAVQQIQPIDESSFNRIDNNTAFGWSSALDYKIIPELVQFKDTDYLANGGVIVNTHDPNTHTATVANDWITANGLDINTFNPVGYDLDNTYTNIEVYSFGVDGGFVSPTIVDATSVSVSPPTVEIEVGQTSALTATVLPADASNKTGVWSSNNLSSVTVSQIGVITGVAQGTATITFTTNDGSFTDTTVVTVSATPTVNVTSVSIAPSTVSLPIGSQTQLTATVLPANATDKSGIWTSNNGNVILVDVDGAIQGFSEGESTITFTTNDGSFSDNSVVTVVPQTDTGLIINGFFADDLNLTLGRGWEILDGSLYFTDGFDNALVTFETNESVVAGDYELVFDIISGGTNRFSVEVNGATVVSTANYPTQLSQTISFNYAGADSPSISLRANNSAGATAFFMDNVILRRVGVDANVSITLSQDRKTKNKIKLVRRARFL